MKSVFGINTDAGTIFMCVYIAFQLTLKQPFGLHIFFFRQFISFAAPIRG